VVGVDHLDWGTAHQILNSMSTPDLPTEIWTYIFYFACMDDGSTGCSLQRVSKHFRELSKYSRLTSVCLYRSKDILRFDAVITPLPPHERRVKYLHITWPHLFLDVSEEELEDDGNYESSDSESSRDNDDTVPTEGGEARMEMDIDESDMDDDEYRPFSPAEESEVHNDVAYLISSATSPDAITSLVPLEGGDSMGDYMAEMDQANTIILSSVNHIISTLSSHLYALSIHCTKESNSRCLSIPDFIPSSTSLPCLTELYLCVNIRSYTSSPIRRDTYPESMFDGEDSFLEGFKGLTFPALRRLRFAGLAWSAIECPYDTVKRIAPNLTHIRTKTDLMRYAPDSLVKRHTYSLPNHVIQWRLGPIHFSNELEGLERGPRQDIARRRRRGSNERPRFRQEFGFRS